MQALELSICLDNDTFLQHDIQTLKDILSTPEMNVVVEDTSNQLKSGNNSILDVFIALSQNELSSGVLVLIADRLITWFVTARKRMKKVTVKKGKSEVNITEPLLTGNRDLLVKELNEFLKSHVN